MTSLNLNPKKNSPLSLSRQLYAALYQQIVSGQRSHGERLPSTRALSHSLNVSRGVVVQAYELLQSDGLLISFGKGGSRVHHPLSEKLQKPDDQTDFAQLSKRGHAISQARDYTCESAATTPLTPSVPDFSLFPSQDWLRMGKLAWRETPHWYRRDSGLERFKKRLRHYLDVYRGIQIKDLRQIIITCGTQSSLSLLAQLLCEPADAAILDRHGWEGSFAALRQAQLEIRTATSDSDGAIPCDSLMRSTPARLIICSPSQQFPNGIAMGPTRRRAWLAFAQRHGAWLIEDDYAAEYSYGQLPAPSILTEQHGNNVIHLGTFSKLLLPSLRVGWMVVPEHIAPAISAAVQTVGLQPPYHYHAQLALFMQYGYLSTHLANTRSLYNQRKQDCLDWLQTHAHSLLRISPSVSSMNSYLEIQANFSPTQVARLRKALEAANIGAQVIIDDNAAYGHPHILIGHSGYPSSTNLSALERLCEIIKSVGQVAD